MPHPQVVTLEHLLNLDELLLQVSEGAEIASDGDQLVVRAQAHDVVFDGKIRTVGCRVGHLTAARDTFLESLGQHRFDLGPAFGGDGVGPASPEPPARFAEHVAVID